jgi:hypothetical protein
MFKMHASTSNLKSFNIFMMKVLGLAENDTVTGSWKNAVRRIGKQSKDERNTYVRTVHASSRSLKEDKSRGSVSKQEGNNYYSYFYVRLAIFLSLKGSHGNQTILP